MTTDELIAAYLKLRMRKKQIEAAAKAEVQDVDRIMAKIENVLHKHLLKAGAQNIKCPSGTAFFTTVTRCSVADWPLVWAFIQENQRWDMLQKAVSKTAVEEYFTKTEQLPPGLNFERLKEVRVHVARGSE